MKTSAILTAAGLWLAAVTSLAAQTFQGPPVDQSFTPAPVKARFGRENMAVFYVKFVNYEGRVAVCGAHVGPAFTAGANKIFLRGSNVSNGDEVLVRNLNFMTDASALSQSWQADIKATKAPDRLRRAGFPAPDYRYVRGVPSVCQVAKRSDFARQGAGRTLVTFVKTSRTVRRKG